MPSKFSQIIGGISAALNPLDGIAGTVGNIITSIKGNPEQQAELANAKMLIELEIRKARDEAARNMEALYISDAESLRELAKVELMSEDWFVRRSRPAWMWGLLGVYVLNYGATAVVSWFGAPAVPVPIPNEVHLLAGVLVGGYGYLRTIEKTGGKAPLGG